MLYRVILLATLFFLHIDMPVKQFTLGLMWGNHMSNPDYPQAILVLGGEPIREQFAAQFAKQHPHLPIFVSSGSPREYAEAVFQTAGIPRQRVTLDYRAVDTVTNFTTMAELLKARQISSIYLITTDFHMPRAQAIAAIILGAQGIKFTPVAIPSQHQPEPSFKTVRDTLRAWWWVSTNSWMP